MSKRVKGEAVTAGGSKQPSAGTLYLLSTPIGNLDDITLRALKVLSEVNIVAAEDTRRTRVLLTHHQVTGKRLVAIHAHTSAAQRATLVDQLECGESVVYATDAGTPSISDPGTALVRDCRERGISVSVLPGPSAVTAAVALSGLGDGGFWFLGFLPRRGTKRQQLLARMQQTPEAVVLFESAERLGATLRELAAHAPEREACVTRELTKLYEECVCGTLAELAERQTAWRGELTLVLGSDPVASDTVPEQGAQLDALMQQLFAQGASVKDVVQSLSQRAGVPKKELYARALALLGAGVGEPDSNP